MHYFIKNKIKHDHFLQFFWYFTVLTLYSFGIIKNFNSLEDEWTLFNPHSQSDLLLAIKEFSLVEKLCDSLYGCAALLLLALLRAFSPGMIKKKHNNTILRMN